MSKLLEGKSLLITGGTGSLGGAVVKRIVTGIYGEPSAVVIFSRDELKQSIMAAEYKDTDYIKFIIGDVRDHHSMFNALWGVDYVINTAAMKRIESCDKYPIEAIKTNCFGMINLLDAIRESRNNIECVVGISSDKGADPLNMYGLTKAVQEQALIKSNYAFSGKRFVCVRYGNVVGSRGSVIPIWQDQLNRGLPITVTDPAMTRFFITLDQAVDIIIKAIESANPSEIYVPSGVPAATISDLAYAIAGGNRKRIIYTGRKPGEKTNETLVTNEEATRTIIRGKYFVITGEVQKHPILRGEYTSRDHLIPPTELRKFLKENGVIQC